MAQVVEINQIGKREDLRDFISIVDMKDKPLLGMIPKLPDQKNMLVSWQADAYATPQSTGVADGVDVDTFENAAANRALIQAYGQKFRRTAMVGDLAENVSNVAGASSGELARSIDKKLEEIGRDIEFALCSDQDNQLEASSATPYKTRGLGSWAQITAQTTLPVPAAFLTPTASIVTGTALTTFTEAIMKPMLASVYIKYGKRNNLTWIVGTDIKQAISNMAAFTAITPALTSPGVRAYTSPYTGSLTTNISTYEGDFNTVEVVPSLLLAGSSAGAQPSAAALALRSYGFAKELLGLTYNRPPNVRKLPDMGGGPRALVEAICCLVVKNPLVLTKTTS